MSEISTLERHPNWKQEESEEFYRRYRLYHDSTSEHIARDWAEHYYNNYLNSGRLPAFYMFYG